MPRHLFSSMARLMTPLITGSTSLLKLLILGCIYGYRYGLSPLLMSLFGARCRFYPSCSKYAIQTMEKDTLGTALKKIVGRVLRCHPYHPGGVDEP